MEFYFFLLLFGAVIALFAGSILGFVANGRVKALEQEVKSLRALVMRQKDQSVSPAPISQTKVIKTEPEERAAPLASEKPAPVPASEKNRAAPPNLPQKLNAPPQSKPSKPKQSLEEIIGAKWSVWVGGLALFLGAVFLLRYTIEAGFFSPALRIFMAALFGAILLGAGEFLRRADPEIGGDSELAKSITQKAYIPGMLTAVGIFALLGTVYAAFALYGFIGPVLAFILMALISLTALALGLLHGPSLAALGLAASLLTPLLIQQDEPNAYTLYTYLAIISLAALALARKRNWGWLSIAALFGSLGWVFISLEATQHIGTLMAWLMFIGCLFTASTYTAETVKAPLQATGILSLTYGTIAATLWAGFAGLAFYASAELSRQIGPQIIAGFGFCAVLFAAGWKWPRQSWYILIGGVLGFFMIYLAADAGYSQSAILMTAVALSAVLIALCYSRLALKFDHLEPMSKAIIWCGTSIILPVFTLILLYSYGLRTIADSIFAGLMLALCAVFAGLTYRVSATSKDVTAMSVYALGAALAYLCAVLMGLENVGVTMGLLIGIILSALAAARLPILVNRMIAAGFGLLAICEILFFQITSPDTVSAVVIFNALWLYFALPAVICAGAAWLVSKQKNDLWSEGLKALSLTFTALFFIFQIRHMMNGGDLFAPQYELDEVALQVLVGLSFTLGGSLIAAPNLGRNTDMHSQLIPVLAMGVSLITLAIFVFAVCIGLAPLTNHGSLVRGGWIFNSLLLAYFLPSLMFGLIAYLSREKRPALYVKIMAGLSLLSFIFYVTSMIRLIFVRPNLSIFTNPPAGLELYMISAIWLLIGIGLLVLGMRGKRQGLRFASAVIIVLTLLKAFLIDMSELEGVLRALSFVGLGLVLIVIGRVYQRLLFNEKATPKPHQENLA